MKFETLKRYLKGTLRRMSGNILNISEKMLCLRLETIERASVTWCAFVSLATLYSIGAGESFPEKMAPKGTVIPAIERRTKVQS